ncbi:hypothetical protein CBI38_24020 [Rhodococcus oxybenzonivorans]|uniref:Glycine zipper domain-containing protein n=1 Tax=Rhodococcus oxybenzonivorans TaxID=1990687 RepID=A0A2S2BZU4_9NOCA|nr:MULTISPECIES: hypothetical protein [Rhodococcus]AWK74161.1 hypothetical protein CBI38_24020 [Rhodococcus oxybenzonivorans]QTJ68100.1 hypothetical protein HYG77_22665 [Rhodococcus sp. ZPP]
MIVRKAAATAGMAALAIVSAAGVSQAEPVAGPASAPVSSAPAVSSLPFHDVASREENDRAFAQFGTQVGIAVTVGSLVGTMAGAGIGCVATLPACLPGLVTGAGIGGVVGTIVAGGPTLGVSAYQLWETYNAAPGTSIYADRDK